MEFAVLKNRFPIDENNDVSALPGRIQTVLVASSVLAVVAFAVVICSAITINRLKDHLVMDLREEARVTAESACERIVDVATMENANSVEQIVNDPSVQSYLRAVSQQNGFVMAAILDDKETVIYQQFCNSEFIKSCPDKKVVLANGAAPGGKTVTWEMLVAELPAGIDTVQMPIKMNEKTIGHVKVGVSQNFATARLEAIGSQITANLFMMVSFVLAVCLFMVYLLYKGFGRALALQRKASENQNFTTMGTLASGMAHEIRNPLHAMNLHLDCAREELEENPGPEEIEAASNTIGRVQQQIRQLETILRNFQNYAMPVKFDLEDLELTSITKDVVCFLRPEMEEKNIALEIDLPELMDARGDQTGLRQVLLNVVINAIHAVEKSENRAIRVTGSQEAQKRIIYIEDSGSGVAEENREKIFQAFRSEKRWGTGFGLAVSRRLMEGQGGAIRVEDGSLGGARFVIELPSPEAGEKNNQSVKKVSALREIPSSDTIGNSLNPN